MKISRLNVQIARTDTCSELTNVARTGTLTVAGTTSAATNVTVNTSNAGRKGVAH
jgi:hypothetical protein